jgi:hypothetical protein
VPTRTRQRDGLRSLETVKSARIFQKENFPGVMMAIACPAMAKLITCPFLPPCPSFQSQKNASEMEQEDPFSFKSLLRQSLDDELDHFQFLLTGFMALEGLKRLRRRKHHIPSAPLGARGFKARKPNSITIPARLNIEKSTGLSMDVINDLYQRTYPHLLRARSLKMLSARGFSQRPRTRFLMVCARFLQLTSRF